MLVGGSGERKTLRLVAKYADACNLFGDPDTVRHKVGVLTAHCADLGRDADEVLVTNLTTALVGDDTADARARATAIAAAAPADEYAARVNAASVEDHIGRFRAYAEAGVQTAIVSLADLSVDAVKRFGSVIAAFPPPDRPW